MRARPLRISHRAREVERPQGASLRPRRRGALGVPRRASHECVRRRYGATGGTGGVGGTGAAAGTGGGGGGSEVTGCNDTRLLSNPATNQRGPWPVGQIRTELGTLKNVVVLYPAKPRSQAGKEPYRFDVRSVLPPAERAKVPESDTKYVSVDSYDNLPIDDAHGPYPAVILVHGTASFSVASAGTMAHWASRGFIAMAGDHPLLNFTDQLTTCPLIPNVSTTIGAEVDSEIAALKTPSGALAPLAGKVDMSRIGLAGHSAGAYNVAGFSDKPGVQVVIALSGTLAVKASSSLKSSLFVGGIADTVLPYNAGGPGIGLSYFPGNGSQRQAYDATTGLKRILGITGGGHLTPTELCQTNAAGQTAIQVAQARRTARRRSAPSNRAIRRPASSSKRAEAAPGSTRRRPNGGRAVVAWHFFERFW